MNTIFIQIFCLIVNVYKIFLFIVRYNRYRSQISRAISPYRRPLSTKRSITINVDATGPGTKKDANSLPGHKKGIAILSANGCMSDNADNIQRPIVPKPKPKKKDLWRRMRDTICDVFTAKQDKT
jgi:hypothetical protein